MNKIQELALNTGRSQVTIYKILKQLHRLPTEEEVLSRRRGRPRKYNY